MAIFGRRKPYETALADPQEAQFQQWRARLPSDLQNMSDYDLRGAWLANAKEAGNGHLPDTWKKPNHMTFSSGSQYSTPQQSGGDWVDSGNGKNWAFWASPTNLQQHSASDLASYFRQYEPDSTVVLPINYKLPRR